MHGARSNATAEAELYAQKRTAEANLLRLTPAFLQQRKQAAIAAAPKVYFGKSVAALLARDQQP